MKKRGKGIIGLLMATILICGTVVPAAAIDTLNSLKIKVNDSLVNFPDARAYLDGNGRVLVPVRVVSEALGANVEWNGSTKTATMTKDEVVAKLTIGSQLIEQNGKEVAMDTAAVLKEGRTFVPVRYVAEAFGATVGWDKGSNTVNITLALADNNSKDDYIDKGGYLVKIKSRTIGDLQTNDPYVEFMIYTLAGQNTAENTAAYEDMRYAIESKFGTSVADEVYNHIKQKKMQDSFLAYKGIYAKDADQWIRIGEAAPGEFTVKVSVYRKGVRLGL